MKPAARATLVVAGASLALATPHLLAFLGRWEGRELTVYADRLAQGLPTVCKGLTRHITDTPIVVGERWSVAKCEAEERRALERVQREIAPCFRLPPPQHIFDMATSHAWNLGSHATCGSGAMAAWNRGEWERGCRRLARGDDGRVVWSFVRTGRVLADGRPEFRFVQGLANRREAEALTCTTGWPT